MITLEDILEEVVGDIQDEFDRLPRSLVPAGHRWVVGGGVTLGHLRQVVQAPGLARELPERTPLSDWILARVPAPRTGETYTIDGFRALVRKMRRGKILEAVLTLETGEREASPGDSGSNRAAAIAAQIKEPSRFE